MAQQRQAWDCSLLKNSAFYWFWTHEIGIMMFKILRRGSCPLAVGTNLVRLVHIWFFATDYIPLCIAATVVDTRWRFPEMGVPPVIIHFRLGFSITNHPASLGYPHFRNYSHYKLCIIYTISLFLCISRYLWNYIFMETSRWFCSTSTVNAPHEIGPRT